MLEGALKGDALLPGHPISLYLVPGPAHHVLADGPAEQRAERPAHSPGVDFCPASGACKSSPLVECSTSTWCSVFAPSGVGVDIVTRTSNGVASPRTEADRFIYAPFPTITGLCAILAFEATEGGAGVLGRMTSEPAILAQVARAALELMHYGDIDKAIAACER